VDDFSTPALCPWPYLVLLDLDRVLLTILRRMSVVRDRTKCELRLLITLVWTFPPISHVCFSCRVDYDAHEFMLTSGRDVTVSCPVKSFLFDCLGSSIDTLGGTSAARRGAVRPVQPYYIRTTKMNQLPLVKRA
jgi:hypothetical protein